MPVEDRSIQPCHPFQCNVSETARGTRCVLGRRQAAQQRLLALAREQGFLAKEEN
jgi:hypothetical protein